MASTKLISPGIPNYTLKRNLRLNDKFISNDGGDEGIRIGDAGHVGIGNTAPGYDIVGTGDVFDYPTADTNVLHVGDHGDDYGRREY